MVLAAIPLLVDPLPMLTIQAPPNIQIKRTYLFTEFIVFGNWAVLLGEKQKVSYPRDQDGFESYMISWSLKNNNPTH